MYSIETAARPNLSMLASEDPKSVKILEAFHKAIGRPEAFLTFGPDSDISFSLHIDKGATIKETLLAAAEDLCHPDSFANQSLDDTLRSARHHVPKLLSHL